MARELDLLVVGGGIGGLSLAVHAARRGLRTMVLEAGPLGGESTRRSGGLVHTHQSSPELARLASHGLEHFERFDELYGGPAGFRPGGFAYVPDPEEHDSGRLAARLAALRAAGDESVLLDPEEARAIDPAVDLADARAVVYQPRSGYADSATTTGTLARAAEEAGARLRPHAPVARLLPRGGEVAGAVARGPGRLAASHTVLCAGSRSSRLAATVGLPLPLRARTSWLVRLDAGRELSLSVIDAPGNVYFRPAPGGSALVGRESWGDRARPAAEPALPAVDPARTGSGADPALPPGESARPAAEPTHRSADAARPAQGRTGPTPALARPAADPRPSMIDPELVAAVRRAFTRRVAGAGATVRATRSGVLDMTPDGLPLIGPAPIPGLWLCCGWNGVGFKMAPAAGERLAGWIATGRPPLELEALDPRRATG